MTNDNYVDQQTGILYRLVTLDDVERITDIIISEVEDWFLDEPLSTIDFLDRLETTLMATDHLHLGGSTDTPAIKAIMKIARKAKRDFATH